MIAPYKGYLLGRTVFHIVVMLFTPLEDVTIGIYPVEEEEVPEEEVPIKDTTDITKQMEESALAAEEAERQANPYDRDNALATGKTDAEGKVTI